MSGEPLRTHLMAIWRKSGKKPEQLDIVLSDDLQFLWQCFAELHNTRDVGMGGMCPIKFSEISAWQQMNGLLLSVRDVRAIKMLDAVVCKPREK